MHAAAEPPFRVLTPHARGPVRAARRGGWLVPGVVAAALLALLLALAWQMSAARRALHALPPERRAAVLARTLDELRQSCGDRPEALREHCRDVAAFAATFEECRGDCEVLVQRHLAPRPTR